VWRFWFGFALHRVALLCGVFVRCCGRASTARYGQAGSVTLDCLPGSTSSGRFALFSIQYLTCSYLIIFCLGFVCFRGICARARCGQTLSVKPGAQSTPRGTAQRLSVNETSKSDMATDVTEHCVCMQQPHKETSASCIHYEDSGSLTEQCEFTSHVLPQYSLNTTSILPGQSSQWRAACATLLHAPVESKARTWTCKAWLGTEWPNM
jgi:hypothetical protein